MARNDLGERVELAVIPGYSKRCLGPCLSVKPLDGFGVNKRVSDGRMARCKPCVNVRRKELRQTDAYQAKQAAYNADPAVRARKYKHSMEVNRRPEIIAKRKEWLKTLRVKMYLNLWNSRYKAKINKTVKGRKSARELFRAYSREIARLEGRTYKKRDQTEASQWV